MILALTQPGGGVAITNIVLEILFFFENCFKICRTKQHLTKYLRQSDLVFMIFEIIISLRDNLYDEILHLW